MAQLAARLAGLPGVVAVVLGGSRAAGTHRPDSDWDLGLYYRARRPFDPAHLRWATKGRSPSGANGGRSWMGEGG